jgi:hypothetical protein
MADDAALNALDDKIAAARGAMMEKAFMTKRMPLMVSSDMTLA